MNTPFFKKKCKNERGNGRIFLCLSAEVSAAHFLKVSAAHFLKVSAELSAAHNFHSERERERHFLVSESYSVWYSLQVHFKHRSTVYCIKVLCRHVDTIQKEVGFPTSRGMF